MKVNSRSIRNVSTNTNSTYSNWETEEINEPKENSATKFEKQFDKFVFNS